MDSNLQNIRDATKFPLCCHSSIELMFATRLFTGFLYCFSTVFECIYHNSTRIAFQCPLHSPIPAPTFQPSPSRTEILHLQRHRIALRQRSLLSLAAQDKGAGPLLARSTFMLSRTSRCYSQWSRLRHELRPHSRTDCLFREPTSLFMN